MAYRIVQFFPGIFWTPPEPPPPPSEEDTVGVPHIRSVGMAISTIGSYVATMDQFVAHWTEVDAFLSPGAVTLKGGYALADFTTDQGAIDAAITAVEDADNIRQGSAADINAS